jgi:hypothetical protein
MNEISTFMKVAVIAVAFIAGYAIVSYVVGFLKRANARRSGNDRSPTGSPFSRDDDSDSDSKPPTG